MGEEARVLLFNSEGATDPDAYRRVQQFAVRLNLAIGGLLALVWEQFSVRSISRRCRRVNSSATCCNGGIATYLPGSDNTRLRQGTASSNRSRVGHLDFDYASPSPRSRSASRAFCTVEPSEVSCGSSWARMRVESADCSPPWPEERQRYPAASEAHYTERN